MQKYVWGIPSDQMTRRRFLLHIPNLFYSLFQYYAVLKHLPKGTPFRQINRYLPVNVTAGISTECLQMIGDGTIQVTLPIESFDEKSITVPLEGEKRLTISPDYIVLCTGYELNFPFLEPDLLRVDYRVMPLFKQVVHINDPTICFLGLPIRVEPLLTSEHQARWVDSIWSGERNLPSKPTMTQDNMNREQLMQKKGVLLRFWHTVDYLPYLDEIAHLGGFYADSFKWSNSNLFIPLVFWPSVPFQFRIDGRGKFYKAKEWILNAWNM
jgi:dimethylaniline monooxygenase (N-oxide forming)